MNADFGGTPLAVGSVFGVRQWEVDDLGRLTGVSFPSVWTPGENVAECKRGQVSGRRMMLNGVTFTWPTLSDQKPEPCSGVSPKCGCGFWAYYDDARWNGESLRGVIEGYGKTTIGTKGFRSEKARIVALCIPGPEKHRRKATWTTWLNRILISVNLGAGAGGFLAGRLLQPVMSSIVAVLLICWEAFLTRRARTSTAAVPAGIAPETAEKLRRNYPDVEFFTDYAAMLAAFPLSTPEEPTPETDPEFWKRPPGSAATPPAHLWSKGGEQT